MLLCVPYLTPDGSEKFEEGLSRVEAGKGLESRSKEIEDGSCPQEQSVWEAVRAGAVHENRVGGSRRATCTRGSWDQS